MTVEMRMFDDIKSYGHFASGFTVSFLPRTFILSLSGVFVLYQTAEHWGDPVSSVLDISEFAAGLVLGLLCDHSLHISSRLSLHVIKILGRLTKYLGENEETIS